MLVKDAGLEALAVDRRKCCFIVKAMRVNVDVDVETKFVEKETEKSECCISSVGIEV